MNNVVVLQARSNSLRLPGKVLLPINGIPVVVLAAQRAANTGRTVIVATSTETTDDALAQLLENHGISCYRGSLSNTLDRFVNALNAFADDSLVFRLTADNVFPDGRLLDDIERDFVNRNLDYLSCNGNSSGLPYGVSVELTRLGHLRNAANLSKCKFDQEHVTPFVKRVFGETYFQKYKELGAGHLRCTIDCLDDYLSVQQVFSGIKNPVQVSTFELIKLLEHASYQPIQSKLVTKLVLGTAQLGMNYGISNKTGMPNQGVAEELIKTAIVNGTPYLDTAHAYGKSEEVIGSVLSSGWAGRVKVITKLSPLSDCPSDANPATVRAFVDASIYQSCSSLHSKTLDVLMLHRANHLKDWNGQVLIRLLEHVACGRVRFLGVSVQTPSELEFAMESPAIRYIQMPFNVLDWRWDNLVPRIRAKRQAGKLIIHVRSSLLQGLLTSSAAEDWQKANLAKPDSVINWLSEQSQHSGSENVASFCLKFAMSMDWIDGVVVGMESMSQLTENIRIFCSSDLATQDMDSVISSRPRLEEHSLNPSFWKKNE